MPPNKTEIRYQHRRANRPPEIRRKGAALLVDELLSLEEQTDPLGGDATAEGKDMAAFSALKIAHDLVDNLAGWAIDHEIGLALEGRSFVPRQPSRLSNDPNYLDAKMAVDDHRHEAARAKYDKAEIDPDADRRILINLLLINPGALPDKLARRATEAFEALELGEIQALVRARVSGLETNAFTRREFELRALAHVEYLAARGHQRLHAQQKVGREYGRSEHTIRKWQNRLRADLGNLEVARRLQFARNAGLTVEKEKAGQAPSTINRSLITLHDSIYGEEALQRNAAAYIAAVRAEQPPTK